MLIERLELLRDPRSYHGREYRLHHIVYFTILALLSSAKTYTDVARFIHVHFEELKHLFHLKWRRAPDPSAIRKILVALDVDEMEALFREDAENLCSATPLQNGSYRQICVDGKTLRGSFSHTKNTRACRVFSAFEACHHLILAHVPLTGDKDHEIPALQHFFETLDLKDVVITADALHCQKKL